MARGAEGSAAAQHTAWLADPLAFLLRKEGFEATVVTDGPAALAEFDRAGADIVLLDLMLPGMSGTDVCKPLRSRSSVPVIRALTDLVIDQPSSGVSAEKPCP